MSRGSNKQAQRFHEPLVDGEQIVYAGEADVDTKIRLYGGARALLYPVQRGEPFGLVMAEAMACGTPVAALDRGAVREVCDMVMRAQGTYEQALAPYFALAAELDIPVGIHMGPTEPGITFGIDLRRRHFHVAEGGASVFK